VVVVLTQQKLDLR